MSFSRFLHGNHQWLFVLLIMHLYGSYAAGIVLSTTPQSRNVSAGTMVELTCSTLEKDLTNFILDESPSVEGTEPNEVALSNGGTQLTLNFTAPSKHSSIVVSCVVIKGTSVNQSTALLMIQGLLSTVGNLTSTAVDNCTLHFTWTAPSTLQGVPINYYTINITRHSDGAVLRSDTTNTTEYLYSVSSLGETLDVVVAAVNDVGTGNATSIMIQSPSSRVTGVSSVIKKTIRNDNASWTYTFVFEEMFVCVSAINYVTIEACLDSSCTNTNGTATMLSNGERRVMATFSDLMENRKYTATLNINYNGGVVQQSQPVGISTFDVHNVTLNGPVVRGRVCLNTTFVEGRVDHVSYILFRCNMTGRNMHSETIVGTSKCIPNVPAHRNYTLIATDVDAVGEINKTAAYTMPGLIVPEYTPVTERPSSNTTTGPPTFSDTIDNVLIVAGSVGVAVVMIAATIIIIMLFTIFNKKKKIHTEPELELSHNDRQSNNNHQDVHQSNNHQSDDPKDLLAEDNYAVVVVLAPKAPHAPPPADTAVQYGKVLMSKGQRQCLECLAKMETLKLNHSTLLELLQPLALQWKQLGAALCPNDIQANGLSDKECLKAVLLHWEENQVTPYTWETLVTVLSSSEVGATYLANELRKKTEHDTVL